MDSSPRPLDGQAVLLQRIDRGEFVDVSLERVDGSSGSSIGEDVLFQFSDQRDVLDATRKRYGGLMAQSRPRASFEKEAWNIIRFEARSQNCARARLAERH